MGVPVQVGRVHCSSSACGFVWDHGGLDQASSRQGCHCFTGPLTPTLTSFGNPLTGTLETKVCTTTQEFLSQVQGTHRANQYTPLSDSVLTSVKGHQVRSNPHTEKVNTKHRTNVFISNSSEIPVKFLDKFFLCRVVLGFEPSTFVLSCISQPFFYFFYLRQGLTELPRL